MEVEQARSVAFYWGGLCAKVGLFCSLMLMIRIMEVIDLGPIRRKTPQCKILLAFLLKYTKSYNYMYFT